MQHITSIGKKAVVALVVTLLVGAGMGLAPARAHADTQSDLEAQIKQLLALVAQLEAQLAARGGTCTFTRDLGYGISGSDVTCLQSYLIGSGFSIPAGATGYYGSQTQGAVAVWQAAHSVIPANGYFGTSSRVEYQNLITAGRGQGGDDNGDDNLKGGTADLDDYNLVQGDDETLHEDESAQEAAIMRFSVNDGDVRVNEVEVRFQPTETDEEASVRPWDYFDTMTLYDDDSNEKLATIDVNSASDWDRVTDGDHPVYAVTFKHLDDIVREDDDAHIILRVGTLHNIANGDMDQTFDIFVPNNGISAEDSTGKDRTTGDGSDKVNVDFDD
jgi:peptidoglycan hydrolase-like protein with peptidoglycan-binding domain